METALKVGSWAAVVIGVLAILSSFSDSDFAAFVGGVMFAGLGAVALAYIKEVKKS